MAKNRPEDPSAEDASAQREAADAASLSFEDALARLEAIVHDLEDGRVGLAEALARYEEGVGLLRRCHQLLERAERKIELLRGVDAEGQPIAAPYDDDPTTLDDKAAQRSHRRSAEDTSSKPRKSSRPPKAIPGADGESAKSPQRTRPSLFGEPEPAGDDSDDFF